MVAIKGLGLFRGGRIAYYLMGRNLDRLMPTFVVVTPYLLIGKLLVSTLATLLCWVALYTDAATMRNLYGLWVPLVGTFGCAWLVAECFSLVHEYAIWAMLQVRAAATTATTSIATSCRCCCGAPSCGIAACTTTALRVDSLSLPPPCSVSFWTRKCA